MIHLKIEKIKKSGKKYKIAFDNNQEITTYDEVILENGLLYHNEVDSDLLNKINKDNDYYDVYYKVIRFIANKLRSRKEIIEFLSKYALKDSDMQNILTKLVELGLLNDTNFAHAYTSDKFYLSSYGPYKIRKELVEHDIDSSIIEGALSTLKDEDIKIKAEKLIKKKVSHSKYSGNYLKQKIINEMYNLGYDKELVLAIYNNIDKDDTALLEKEYQKLYKKLSLKYQDKELYSKIKQKLYQKGFKLEDINKIIDAEV